MTDPTTDYEKALALFSKLPKPKPARLIDPKNDFRSRVDPNVKSGMVSSVVDMVPKKKEWSPNALMSLVNDQQAKTQAEIEKQQRRVAAQGVVNGLGGVVKSLFSAYGASKGAPISPVKSTSQVDIARMDEIWNQQMNMQQRANAEKLQLMLEDIRNGRADQQYWERYNQAKADEQVKDDREFGQQKTLYGMQEAKQKELAAEAFERNKILYGVKSEAQQALLDQKEAARKAELEQYGKFAPKSTPASQQEKIEPVTLYIKGPNGESIPIKDSDYNETLTTLEKIKNENAQPVLNKRGKSTGEYQYKDERFKGLDDIDLTTKTGQEQAVRTYYKVLQEPTKAPASEAAGQPAVTPKGTSRKGMTIDDFGKSIDMMFNDNVFRSMPRETKSVHLRTIFQAKQKEIPELTGLSQDQIDAYISEYMDKYFPEKVNK